MNRTLIALAVYNERENLPDLLNELLTLVPDADILVVDDNSPDGTGVWTEEFSQTQPRVKVLHRAGKLGLGTAVIDAMKFAIDRGYEFMLNMDADFSHQPKYVPDILSTMYAAPESVVTVIGSRYVPGGGVEGWPVVRKIMSAGVNAYARFMLSLPVRDTSGSFRCYRVSILKELDFSAVRSKGYSFFEEILWHIQRAARRKGIFSCPFIERPIIFTDRVKGQSKINKKEAVNALRILFQQGIQNWFGEGEFLTVLFNCGIKAAAIVYTVMLIVLLVIPDPYFFLNGVPDPNTEESKVASNSHLNVFILMGFLWELAFFRRLLWNRKWLAWLGAVAFGAFFEIIQIIVPKRTFDPVDINQNMVGAVVGLIIAYVLWTLWKRIAHLPPEKS